MIYLAIPDVHGEISQLESLIDRLASRFDLRSPLTRVVFLGDLIDRGEDSDLTLEFVRDFKLTYPKTILLWGNHELATLKLGHGSDERGLRNPLAPWILEFLREQFLPWFETPGFLFCHGTPENSQTDLDPENWRQISKLVWNDAGLPDGWQGKYVIRGHTPGDRPYQMGRSYFLDCGAGSHGPLIAGVFKEENYKSRPEDPIHETLDHSNSPQSEGIASWCEWIAADERGDGILSEIRG